MTKRSLEWTVGIWFAVAVLLAVGCNMPSMVLHARLGWLDERVGRSSAALGPLEDLRDDLVDTENWIRDHRHSEKRPPRYVYEQAVGRVRASLAALSADSGEEDTHNLARLESMINHRLENEASMLSGASPRGEADRPPGPRLGPPGPRLPGGGPRGGAPPGRGPGRNEMERILALINEISAEERGRIEAYARSGEVVARWSTVAQGLGLLTNLAILGLVLRRVWREMARRRGAEREREKVISELHEARDEALVAARAKGVFLANMSHEIRTPMTGVIGTAELLAESDLDSSQREYVTTIRSSGETLQRVLDDVLDLSKIEAGRMGVTPTATDLPGLMEEVAGLMAPPASRKGLRLNCVVASEVPGRVRCDAVRVRQILTNLLGNAIKFTEAGEVVLEARLLGRGSGDAALAFSVRDSGVGIAPEHRRQIFESFTQGPSHPDGRPRADGTGLGLTISRRLAELMGGRIELESEVGLGSTFSLLLTLPELPPAPGEGREGELAGLRVMVIAPAGAGRESATEALRRCGGRVAVAETIAEALEAAEQDGPPEVVALDATLPAPERARSIGQLRAPLVLLGKDGAAEAGAPPSVGEPICRGPLVSAIRRATGAGVVAGPAPETMGLGLRVLLAEDFEANRRIIGQMLERIGCRVDAVNDGRSAVEAALRTAYDAILMDVEMPELDGPSATLELRRLEPPLGRRTPVLALTAHAMGEDHARCLEAGMDGFASKPVRLAALRDILSGLQASRHLHQDRAVATT